MRLLVDNNLSPALATALVDAGHDATHLRDHGLRDAPDRRVLEFARGERRVLVSADTDFGMLLARDGGSVSSVLLLRTRSYRRPAAQAALLVENIPALVHALDQGALVVLEDTRVRVRPLPL